MSHDEDPHDGAPTPPATVTGEDRRALTRRRFVGLIAAGAGATLAGPALAAGSAARRRAPAPAPSAAAPPSPKVAKGLDEQRDSLAKTLKTIREFELPPGSEQGFAFRPLSPRGKP